MWPPLPHPVSNLFFILIYRAVVVSILHFILLKFPPNFSTQNYFGQIVYSMLLSFNHSLIAWVKQELLVSALKFITTWWYIPEKCKINLFNGLKNYKVIYWWSLAGVSKESIASYPLKAFLKTSFGDWCSCPSRIPILTAFPLHGSSPHFLSPPRLLFILHRILFFLKSLIYFHVWVS